MSSALTMCAIKELFFDADENLITAQLWKIRNLTAKINGSDKDEEDDDEKDRAKIMHSL